MKNTLEPVLIEGETAINLLGYQVMFSEALGAMPRYKPIGKGGEKIGKQVFPGNMTVKAMPKLKKFGNEILLGHLKWMMKALCPPMRHCWSRMVL